MAARELSWVDINQALRRWGLEVKKTHNVRRNLGRSPELCLLLLVKELKEKTS